MPTATIEDTSLTFKHLAALAFAEFCSRLGDDQYDLLDSLSGATTLSVQVFDDAANLSRQLTYAARALAKECNRREFTALALPPVPAAIESVEVFQRNNIAMRVCKAWDVMKGRIIYRLDVIGVCGLPEVEANSY